jgi:hypothetical protein
MKLMDVIVESTQEMRNHQDIEKVIKGFHLIPTKMGFGKSYTTKDNKPSIDLKNEINSWIYNTLGNHHLYVDIEKTYKTFNFRTKHKK